MQRTDTDGNMEEGGKEGEWDIRLDYIGPGFHGNFSVSLLCMCQIVFGGKQKVKVVLLFQTGNNKSIH